MKTSVDALNWTCDIKVQLQDIFFYLELWLSSQCNSVTLLDFKKAVACRHFIFLITHF